MLWRKLAGRLLTAVVLLGTAALLSRAPVTAVDSPARLDFDASGKTRLLVLAPHPDDEALAAAGLIRRVVASNGTVRVVALTSGDAFAEGVEREDGITHPSPRDFRAYGVLREHETAAAMLLLGVPRQQITFLGFPDGGLCALASKYLSAKVRAFESPFTDRVSPPLTEQVIRGMRYRGADVRSELERVITEFAPTLVLMPHAEDEHPDHCSTRIFGKEALDQAARRRSAVAPRVLHYLVHYGQWPLDAAAGAGAALRPPDAFPPAEGQWRTFELTPEEASVKKQALLAYSSQMLVIGRFMLAFGRTNELFLEGEPASLPECWCDGENVATELPPPKYRRRPARRP